MGKNHRHTKKVKSEKAKVHLSSKTKFLPKGQNVTNTEFKIRPIVVQDQLKRVDSSSPFNKSHLSIPDLVAKFKHSTKVKVEACTDLSSLIQLKSLEEIGTHLPLIMRNVVSLIQDREGSVRKAVIKLLTCLLEKVPQDKLAAFTPHISSNLRCAMTHIDKKIQQDSLRLLDALLEFSPRSITQNSFRILSDFLMMISKQRYEHDNVRTLSMGLSRKITSAQWRIEVLTRLYRTLKASMESDQRRRTGTSNTIKTVTINNDGRLKCISILPESDCFELGASNFAIDDGDNNASKITDNWKLLISTLLSLLHQIWVEVMPRNEEKVVKKSEVTVLHDESATVLTCIVHILYLVRKYVTTDAGSKAEFVKVLEYLASNFPYMEVRKRSLTANKTPNCFDNPQNDPKLLRENLTLIYLMSQITLGRQQQSLVAKRIEQYLNQCLTSQNYFKSNNIDLLLDTIEAFLSQSKNWHRSGFDLYDIVDKTIELFELVADGRVKSRILTILTKADFFLRSDKCVDWLENLPLLLCRNEIDGEIVEVILNLAKCDCVPLLKGLRIKMADILGNLRQIKIHSPTENRDKVKMALVYSFFYISNLGDEEIAIIHEFIHKTPDTYADYFESMLQFRQHFRRDSSTTTL